MSCNRVSWIILFLQMIFLILLILPTICKAKRTKLYIAGFFPTSENISQGSIGRGVLPAVNLALQHINSSNWLHNYHLNLVWNDTKCDTAVGMKEFYDMLDDKIKVPKVILFGDACTEVTDPIAKASKFFHLMQLSYADTHPMYTTQSYPNFFRIVPSEAAFNPARVALLNHFNWTKVGTIYQNSPRYSLPHSKLLTELDKAGVEIVATQSLAEELSSESYLQKLKDKDVRIILGNFDEDWARRVFCQAYKNGLYGRKYQWLIVGLYGEKWWHTKDSSVDCTEEQLLTALDGYIMTDVLPLSSSKEKTETGITPSEYNAQYDKERGREYSKFHGYAYDGILAIARTIRSVYHTLQSSKSSLSLKEFKYRDAAWGNLFREALNQTTFIGVTGKVIFENNERKGLILINQFQGVNEHKVAEYDSNTDGLNFNGLPMLWNGGTTPPVDRTTIMTIPSRVSITLFIVISIFAVLGIIMAFVFLAMNIKYRNQRYIKMSSPYLNNLIIIGCILTYTSVILLGLDSGLTSESNFPYICAARAWVLMSGFTLAFGSMFSKTWRVHAIFTDIKLNKKLIKDYKLFMIVGILVFIDVATLTTWQIVDPFYRDTKKGTPERSPKNEDLWIVPEMEFCQSNEMTIFLGSIYVYKGLLMAFGIFLAWETRHVSIPALNDSKYIGMSVYNVVIMCVIGAGLSFMLREQQDAAFVIISIFIIFCSTATLCLVFVPKLIELKRNPNAGDRKVRATLKPFQKARKDSDEMELHTRIKIITDDNFRFRQRLKEKTYELEALMFRVRSLEESEKSEIITSQVETYDTKDMNDDGNNGDKRECNSFRRLKVTSPKCSSLEISNNGLYYQKKSPESCPTLSEHKKDLNESEKNGSSEVLPTRQLSLIERVRNNRESRFGKINTQLNNEKSSSSSSSNTSISYKQSNFQSPQSGDEQFMQTIVCESLILESDDTSYAKAIKQSSKRKNLNGFSSSIDEDDTDKNDQITSHSDASNGSRPSVRRRAQSLGVLSDAPVTSSVEAIDPFSSSNSSNLTIAHSNLTNTQEIENTFIRLFPYFNRNNGHHLLRSGSSCPQVRCDIIEYL